MKKETLQTKKIWVWFGIIIVILLIGGMISNLNKPVYGQYKSAFPQLSIDLEEGGKVIVYPHSSETNTDYCVTEGRWLKNNNSIEISLDNNQYCDWTSKLNGTWSLTRCKNFDGSSNWCISNGDFYLKKVD